LIHECKTNLLKLRDRLSHQVLDIYQWPMFNINVSLLHNKLMRIHVSFDNLIFDGWSMFTLLEQWSQIYFDYKIDNQLTHLSFRDYVLYLNKIKKLKCYEEDQAYWFGRISRFLKAPNIPMAQSTSQHSNIFTRRSHHIDEHMWNQLKDRAQSLNITPTTLLIGVYAEAIRQVSTNDNFSLNITQFNRIPVSPDINKVIGDFTTLTLLEVDHGGEQKLSERLKRIQTQLVKNLEHNKYSGVEFQRDLRHYCEFDDYVLMPFVFTSGLGIHALNSRKQFGEITYNISQTPQVWLDNQVIERDNG